YKKECVLAPLFKMLEAIFELFVPLVMTLIIDTGIGQGDKPLIVRCAILLVALGIIGLVSSLTAQYFSARAAVGFSARVRHALFSHVQQLSYTELDTLGSSGVITRLTSDINQVQSGVNLVLRLFMRSPFVVFGAMIMAFTVDVKGAIPFVVVIPLLSLVVFGVMLLTMPLYKKVQQRLDRILRQTRENLSGVRVIRAFNRQEAENIAFDQNTDLLLTAQLKAGRLSALMNPLTYVIVNGGIVALLYTGALQVDSGALTCGAVIALVNYMSQILVELVKLANLIITVTKAWACGDRIQAVLDTPNSMPAPEASVTASKTQRGAVTFDHVTLTYKSAGSEALSPLSFSAAPGETVGIIGGTGSGKTSLVNLIPRFYDATDGIVTVNGVDVQKQDPEALREQIGIVPQKAVLFKGTVRSNLLWGNPDASDEQLWQALELAQAKNFVAEKPGGLDCEVAQGGKNFSGGQRQRLTIARAFVKRPAILILDDSASALDYLTDAALRESIRNMQPRPTTFIVSQRTASLRHADNILVLDDGELVGQGTHEELLNSCPVYQEIYYSQYPKEVEA
ncbi:MAG: ABC transporter ATP-binding protein, partial [Clostridia bacterium]|nr:ABC transporter ATP-binding protein [Clostridia bacterium]